MQTSQKLLNKFFACALLAALSRAQLASVDLPPLKAVDLDSPNFVSREELTDPEQFLLTRSVLGESECQVTLWYAFAREALVAPFASPGEKQEWTVAKYVAPGSPLLLFSRKVEATLKRETFFLDLCREGDWTELRGLPAILRFFNALDWDPGYLQLWNAQSRSPKFLVLAQPGPLRLEQVNLELDNRALFGAGDEAAVDFSLPLVDKAAFADHLTGVVENAIKESLKALYQLNAATFGRAPLLEAPSLPSKLLDNVMPFVSRFFGLALRPERAAPVKRVDVLGLKLDIDHIVNLMKSELLGREELFEKSREIHARHRGVFLPMTKNKLFVLTQMIWRIQETDPFRQVNHLLAPQLRDTLALLRDPLTPRAKFRVHFAEVFMLYYSQVVCGFDSIGQPTPYVAFVTQYLTDIFNRIKAEMEGLAGLVTRDKTRLMAKVQGALISAYNLLKSNEPVLLPALPRLVRSAEVLGDRFLRDFRAAGADEQARILASLELMRNMGGLRQVQTLKLNPFALAAKTKVLL